MKALIKIHNQGSDLLADSRDIAVLFGVEHQHLRETIEKNGPHLSQLGHVRFETGDGIRRPQGGGKQEKFIYLNFDQIALLLTLTRTTEQTKEFQIGRDSCREREQ